MAQPEQPEWVELPSLPDANGFAGMYAGVSHGTLICMGGANFPDEKPWQGGTKKWYDSIFLLGDAKKWIPLDKKLPQPSGYGVTVSYKNRLILTGGSNAEGHMSRVLCYEWNGEKLLELSNYPDLPGPLANMTGTLLGDVLLLLGGSESPSGPPLKTVLALDLSDPSEGWQKLEPWPGPERLLPVCGVHNDRLFFMGGETTGLNALGEKFRHILLDNYSLQLKREGVKWKAVWEKLAPIPRGVSAAGSILPLVQNNRFLIWGGVDAVTAQYKDPATHPGINPDLLYYFPETDIWEYLGARVGSPARVTLPVVLWNHTWVYISGEIKPGIRTPTILGVKEN